MNLSQDGWLACLVRLVLTLIVPAAFASEAGTQDARRGFASNPNGTKVWVVRGDEIRSRGLAHVNGMAGLEWYSAITVATACQQMTQRCLPVCLQKSCCCPSGFP